MTTKQEPEIRVYSVLPPDTLFAKYGQEIRAHGHLFVKDGDRQDLELSEEQVEEMKKADWSVHKTVKKTKAEQLEADAKTAEEAAEKRAKEIKAAEKEAEKRAKAEAKEAEKEAREEAKEAAKEAGG